jgi:hypothetical protein
MSWWTFSDLFQEHAQSQPGAPVDRYGIPSIEFSDVYGIINSANRDCLT